MIGAIFCKGKASVIGIIVFEFAKIALFVSQLNLFRSFLTIIISAKCEYGNKTYDINQTFITLDCTKRCACAFVNGTAKLDCSSLCTTPKDPGCRSKTQQVEEYQQPLRGTKCLCAAKRCIPGLRLFKNNYVDV